MTRTAVLFVDTKERLGGETRVCVPITDVPLVKRNVIDLRRAGFANIFVVMDERTAEVEAVLDDVRRTEFKRRTFSEGDWREEIQSNGDEHVLVFTSDRLCDHKFLQNFAEMSMFDEHSCSIAVDTKDASYDYLVERRFRPNDAHEICRNELSNFPDHQRTGVYLLPSSDVAQFSEQSAPYLRQKAEEFESDGRARYFDIGNGFVQEIDSKRSIRTAEQRIIRYIWKPTDGPHGRFNKRILLPVLKIVLRTSLTPNMVSLAGVIVSLFSGYFYAKGIYAYALLGGVLGFASSLLDHIDGCIARLKSKESAFGAHFDTVCDYVYYSAFGIGITAGLYRSTHNPIYIWLGIAVLCGIAISLVIISYLRKTRVTNASLFAAEAHKKLDDNLQNPIIWFVRRSYFVIRRPAVPVYLLIFTALNALPFVLFMTALSANLFWMFNVYTSRLLSPQPKNLN